MAAAATKDNLKAIVYTRVGPTKAELKVPAPPALLLITPRCRPPSSCSCFPRACASSPTHIHTHLALRPDARRRSRG